MGQLRYERKYLTEDYLASQLENFIKTSSSLFKPIYYKRRVWSMYFDTPDLSYFQQNLIGDQHRKKVRVRWYEHDKKLSPIQLEMKTRVGEMLKKDVYKLDKKINDLSIKKLQKYLSQWLKLTAKESYSLSPIMVNSYQRQYFSSNKLLIRLTIDDDLRFQSAKDYLRQRLENKLDATILEAKYQLKQDNRLGNLLKDLPLRLSKSSKYMMGVQLCC